MNFLFLKNLKYFILLTFLYQLEPTTESYLNVLTNESLLPLVVGTFSSTYIIGNKVGR